MDFVRPSVPVIGVQKRQVKMCGLPMITAVALCDCGQAQPIIIPAIDRAGVCVGCKTQYVISRIDFRNESGDITLNAEVSKWYGPAEASKELAVSGVPGTC